MGIRMFGGGLSYDVGVMTELSSMARDVLGWCLPVSHSMGAQAAELSDWGVDGAGVYCWQCGVSVNAAAVTESGCPHCRNRRLPWSQVYRLGAYKTPLSDWVVSLKFHGHWPWADFFGEELARVTRSAGDDGAAIVVPVPLHPIRRLARGYDQALLIGRAFGRAKGIACERILRRKRYTRPQTRMMSPDQRRRNLRGAFGIKAVDLTGMTVWLIDDVSTTGTTVKACARLLKRAGAKRVNVAVVAVADPK